MKDAPINLPPDGWVVIDENGQPCHVAGWPEACHEHINNAMNEHELAEAKNWRVRPYILADRAGRECPTCHNAYQGQPAPTFVSAAPSPAEPKPDRTGMAYYKRNECTAASADSPDCICWSPAEPPAAPVQQEPYSIVYDGDSLPMIAVGKRLYRAQEFVRGQWRTLDHPQLYKELFAHPSEDLRAELAEAKDANKARIAELEKRQAWLASVGPANHPDDERHFAMAFVRANERAEAAEQRVAALEAQIKAAPEGMVVSTRTLKFWREYWNGNYNELAMSNALDFLMGQFDDVIAAAGAQEGKAL